MLKARFGEDVVKNLQDRLEIKATEVHRKDNKGGKRKGG